MRSPGSEAVWPHRMAVTLACATFPLLFIGGLVTSKGAGLAVPDWPTTFGYNMFLYPWSKMVGGVFYEHSHRLIGSTVGLLTVVLALWLWTREPRPWVRWLGLVAVLGVIVQGVLGGLRVVLVQHGLALVHACVAQAFLGLMVGLAVVTSSHWQNASPPRSVEVTRCGPLALVTATLVYLQIGFGVLLTHTGGWLSGHLMFAGLVTGAILLLAGRILAPTERPAPGSEMSGARSLGTGSADPGAPLRRLAVLLVALVGIQLGLGIGAYLWRFAGLGVAMSAEAGLAILATHRLTGTLLWATTVVLWLWIARSSVGEGLATRPGSAAPLSGRYEPRPTNPSSSEVLA